ncbi:hypothetical protein [Nannocystis punicea]|uniref:Bacteriophage lambda head decoration protein D n=1 Tax=Nannocystis punicea TaxID=2995304 RepID=A0ABY7HDE3_9BACT|nr:hypothetical protein [Nannocystis poenicansa]WAS97216.1 hypothetical protein O0S08_13795 [Nannocystis poenicansa]
MPTTYDDDKLFRGDCTFEGAVDMSGASGTGVVKMIEVPFTLTDIQAGSLSSDAVPVGALILGAAITMTTALTFSGGDTTGVTLKAGTSGDDDGYFAATQLSGATGSKRPAAAGALIGLQVAGDAGSCALVFAATGGSPDLADVTAGAGKLMLAYTLFA